jgi:hypothetical protein
MRNFSVLKWPHVHFATDLAMARTSPNLSIGKLAIDAEGQ